MKRREFLAGSGMLALSPLESWGADAAGDADARALEQLAKDYYAVYYHQRDKEKYRSLLTSDYLLLENGEIMDAAADLAVMPARNALYERTNAFDFRHAAVKGESAYLVYFLDSQIKDKDGRRDRRWLETLIFRRSAEGWRIALLHSTRIAPAAKKRLKKPASSFSPEIF